MSNVNRLFNEGIHFEEQLIHALLVDNLFAEQIMEVLDPKYFTQTHLRHIAKSLYNYYTEYKKFPSLQLMEGKMQGDETCNDAIRQQMAKTFIRIRKDPLTKDLQYIKNSSLEFCRKQRLLLALEKCLDLTEEKNFADIVRVIQEATSAGSEKDYGHIYENELETRMTEANRNPVATPWEPLNAIISGGVSAGELAVILALTGVGKSHALVDVGAAAALAGKNVVHFTFELGEVKLGKRYDARLSGIPYDDLVANKERVKTIVDALPGTIRIKKYPNRIATVQTIRNYVNKLRLDDIVPDIIIVDYADIMKSGKNYENKRFEEEAVYEELRSLADELMIPIWTASQTNRSGMDVEVLTLKHIAECFSKANIADLFITMNRKKTGEIETLGNFFVAKSRLGPDGVKFNVLVNTALSSIKCIKPGSAEEKQAIAEYDLKLESDESRIRKRVERMKERDDLPMDRNNKQIEFLGRLQHLNNKPNGNGHTHVGF